LQGGEFFTQKSSLTLNTITVKNTYANTGGIFYGLDENPLIV